MSREIAEGFEEIVELIGRIRRRMPVVLFAMPEIGKNVAERDTEGEGGGEDVSGGVGVMYFNELMEDLVKLEEEVFDVRAMYAREKEMEWEESFNRDPEWRKRREAEIEELKGGNDEEA